MFACSSCGCDGASYCTMTDENGNVCGEYFHIHCIARKVIAESNVREARDFASVQTKGAYGIQQGRGSGRTNTKASGYVSVRGTSSPRPPHLPKTPVHQMWLRVGSVGQRGPLSL